MKPSCTKFLLLIACLPLLAAPLLAQTGAPPAQTEVAARLDAPLPDAPNPEPRSAPLAVQRPTPGGTQWVDVDREFVMATSVLFGSSIANAELTTRCINSGFCTAVPGPLRSRGALYGVGLPADAGVTVLGYLLKHGGHRWWFVPAALVTAGNSIYAVHASQHIR